MTRTACGREQDVVDAILSRRWPDRCEPQLREHVRSCAVCADLAAVAGAFLDPDAADVPAHDLPPAGVVWWKAQLRAREDAARRAIRPIRLAQIAALACAAVLGVVLVAFFTPDLRPWLAWAASRLHSVIPGIDTRAATDAALASLANRGVQLAVGSWLVLGPVAVYLAFSRD